MNHKIQEIIGRAAQRLVSDNEFVAIIRRARPGAGPIAASVILRALLEVIGEAGVEGALERIAEDMEECARGGRLPEVWVRDNVSNRARAALRTLKELQNLSI